ncbi:hypothetical protein F66182_6618 [Fusarium sp. NRRL 66182]|nr:hypothetical protein F66182_6618 [Fusarium sp. NRRL 66182]
MYLIDVSTFKLQEFYSDIPRYAILSHTWGRTQDEVTFQEMSNPAPGIKLKRGYRKIELCARQAQQDGLSYCWVDTCCIDKSSSAELSEAINSMFSWYKNAVICYIYLEDVDRDDPFGESFERARWFSRGWTLQELIAPRKRRFYDQSWSCIGEISREMRSDCRVNGFYVGKNARPTMEATPQYPSLAAKVKDITGISAEVFDNPDLETFSAATKMSWASVRETTRVEDQAYCLLGIFNVNMPLLYGEGANAFIRLQEEIIRKKADHTLFAWRSASVASTRTFSGLLSPSPRIFKGSHCRSLVAKEVEMPYEMTNKGLHLQIRLIEAENPDEYYAMLDVGPGEYLPSSKDYRYAIKLGRLDAWDQFARIDSDTLHCQEETDLSRAIKPSHVYIQHLINYGSPNYGRNRINKVILSCIMESMSLSVLKVLSSNYWTPEALTFIIPNRATDRFYAQLAIQSTPRQINLLAFTLGLLVKGDDRGGVKPELAILTDQNDIYRSSTTWNRSIRIADTEIFTETTFKIVCGELVATIWLCDRPAVSSFDSSRDANLKVLSQPR